MASCGVTFKIAEHPANQVSLSRNSNDDDGGNLHLVSSLPEYHQEGCGGVLQGSHPGAFFRSANNGFVHAVVDAYCHHHNLIIRPDDVWLAIVLQFSFYVNANAEAFRSVFVSHQGKKELKVYQVATLHTARYDLLATDMVSELRANLKDPKFCDWVLPHFSTTTSNDTIVGSVALMGTMKQYFDYKFCLTCGIPEVTLAGTVKDWEDIHARVQMLKTEAYGKVCSSWASMLSKITTKLIQTSRNDIDLEFWSKICDYRSGGSGPSYLSGWITTFCAFNGKGEWQATKYSIPSWRRLSKPEEVLEFPVIDTSDIPPGYTTVDVTVDDNGREYKTLMFAGHVGYNIVEDGKGMAPKLAWAIALKSEDKLNATNDTRRKLDEVNKKIDEWIKNRELR